MSATAITRFDGGHWFLSNFSPSRVQLDGGWYPSVEHAYQAGKTTDLGARREIAACRSPGRAKRLGRRVVMRPHWHGLRLLVMEDLLRQKFAPGSLLAGSLLSTGNADLVEGNHWGDVFWGVCGGEGENHLGLLLMKIREELQ